MPDADARPEAPDANVPDEDDERGTNTSAAGVTIGALASMTWMTAGPDGDSGTGSSSTLFWTRSNASRNARKPSGSRSGGRSLSLRR